MQGYKKKRVPRSPMRPYRMVWAGLLVLAVLLMIAPVVATDITISTGTSMNMTIASAAAASLP